MTEPKRTKRGQARYVYRWWEGEVRRKASFDRKADRDAFRDEIRRRQQSHGLLAFERDVTLDALVEAYWRLHAVPNLEASTRSVYAQQWGKWIQPRLGGYQLRAISTRVVHRQLIDEMRQANAGEPTIRYTLAVLQSILRFAVVEGRIEFNPVAAVTKPRVRRSRQVEPVPPATVERLRGLLNDETPRSSRSWPMPACVLKRRWHCKPRTSPTASSSCGGRTSTASSCRTPRPAAIEQSTCWLRWPPISPSGDWPAVSAAGCSFPHQPASRGASTTGTTSGTGASSLRRGASVSPPRSRTTCADRSSRYWRGKAGRCSTSPARQGTASRSATGTTPGYSSRSTRPSARAPRPRSAPPASRGLMASRLSLRTRSGRRGPR